MTRVRRFIFHGFSFTRLFMASTVPGVLGEPFVRLVRNPLPCDAEVVDVRRDQDGRLVVIVHSETFSPVADGDVVPVLPSPEFEIVRAAEGSTP